MIKLILKWLGFKPPLPRSKRSKKVNRRPRDYTPPTRRALGSPAKGARVKSRRNR